MNSSRLKFLLRALVSMALIWFVFRKLEWRQVGVLLQTTDPVWAISGFMLTFLLMLLLAVRWRIFLGMQSMALPLSTVFPLTWSGQFFNSVLPGSTGGDFVKIYQLCRLFPDRKAAGAVTVLIDRVSASIALLALAGIAFLRCPISWSDVAGSRRIGNEVWVIAVAGVIVAAGLAALLIVRHAEAWMPRIARVFSALRTSLSPSPALGAALLLSFGIHLLNFLGVFCFARSLGIVVTYGQVLLFLPVLLLLVMMPVTVNGHGLREVLLIFYFSKLGITLGGGRHVSVQETAIALSALMVANDLLWSLPGGLWYFFRFRSRQAIRGGAVVVGQPS